MKDEPKSQRTMPEILAEIRKTFAEDESDFEPSLVSPDQVVSPTRWGYSPRADLEEQCEDEAGTLRTKGAPFA